MKVLTYAAGDGSRCGLLLGEHGEDLEVLDLQLLAGALARTLTSDAQRFLLNARDASSVAGATPAELSLLQSFLEPPVASSAIRKIPRGCLLAPLPDMRRNLFCVGRNYLEHVREGDLKRGIQTPIPQYPQFFTKPPSTVIGDGAAIEIERQVSEQIDYEIELGVVIGRPTRNVTADEAMEAVFGYTILNDVTARDLQRRHDQWFKGKGLDTFCPMGPWIVTRDEIADPHALDLKLWVNEGLRQSDNTAQMHFRIGRLIADLSLGMTLMPGDVIATGTPPGVGYAMNPPQFLRAGDWVTCEIQGIGRMRNPVRERRAD